MVENIDTIHAGRDERRPRADADRTLYTATLRVIERDGSSLEVFHACRTATIGQAIARLSERVGPEMSAASNVRRGIDVCDPTVLALMGPVLAARLAAKGDLAGSALLLSGDLHIVQRRG